MINQYKAKANKFCNDLERGRLPLPVARDILKNKKTKGAKAALLTGLVIGALVERGKPDLAEKLLKEINELISDN